MELSPFWEAEFDLYIHRLINSLSVPHAWNIITYDISNSGCPTRLAVRCHGNDELCNTPLQCCYVYRNEIRGSVTRYYVISHPLATDHLAARRLFVSDDVNTMNEVHWCYGSTARTNGLRDRKSCWTLIFICSSGHKASHQFILPFVHSRMYSCLHPNCMSIRWKHSWSF
jgi:hypothetical protein